MMMMFILVVILVISSPNYPKLLLDVEKRTFVSYLDGDVYFYSDMRVWIFHSSYVAVIADYIY